MSRRGKHAARAPNATATRAQGAADGWTACKRHCITGGCAHTRSAAYTTRLTSFGYVVAGRRAATVGCTPTRLSRMSTAIWCTRGRIRATCLWITTGGAFAICGQMGRRERFRNRERVKETGGVMGENAARTRKTLRKGTARCEPSCKNIVSRCCSACRACVTEI